MAVCINVKGHLLKVQLAWQAPPDWCVYIALIRDLLTNFQQVINSVAFLLYHIIFTTKFLKLS